MHYLTLVAIAKDETRNLREWLVYHTLLGVEAFIVYDNESRIPIRETLAPFLRNGFLKVVEISGKNMQLTAYDHALREFGRATRWMGFIDLDEFIVPQTTDDLRHFLLDYEAHAGLAVNWVTYGSSGHVKRPNGLMIENYTGRLELDCAVNYHIKSIVKPDCTLRSTSPHSFAYRPGCFAVNPDGVPIATAFSPPCHDRIRINHYFFRSQEEFEEKIKRGRADTDAPGTQHRIEEFDRQMNAEHEQDLSAHKYLDKLKALLRSDNADEIIAIPRRSIAQDPPGYLTAFVDMTRLGDTAKAELILREALTRFPDEPTLISLRATSLRHAGDIALARAEAGRSLFLRPTPQALAELSAIVAAQGDQAQAERIAAYQKFMTEYGLMQ